MPKQFDPFQNQWHDDGKSCYECNMPRPEKAWHFCSKACAFDFVLDGWQQGSDFKGRFDQGPLWLFKTCLANARIPFKNEPNAAILPEHQIMVCFDATDRLRADYEDFEIIEIDKHDIYDPSNLFEKLTGSELRYSRFSGSRLFS